MVILYLVLGIAIIINGMNVLTISQDYARVLGVMLVLYGIFRGYKLYRRYFSRQES